jgi:hypothetical protein
MERLFKNYETGRARYLRYKAEHLKEVADQSETKKETPQAEEDRLEPIRA